MRAHGESAQSRNQESVTKERAKGKESWHRRSNPSQGGPAGFTRWLQYFLGPQCFWPMPHRHTKRPADHHLSEQREWGGRKCFLSIASSLQKIHSAFTWLIYHVIAFKATLLPTEMSEIGYWQYVTSVYAKDSANLWKMFLLIAHCCSLW